jgi:protein-tyrosine phosphatase
MVINQKMNQCYWVVQNKFLAGEYPRSLEEKSSREKIVFLIKAGVSAFIDLTEESEGLKPYSHLLDKYKGVSHDRFPMQDMSIPAAKEITVAVLDAIDKHIQEERIVYVHCWGGVGRTGVIVGCWLARHGWRGDSALVRLRELWQQCPKSAYRITPETKEQRQYIAGWEETQRK